MFIDYTYLVQLKKDYEGLTIHELVVEMVSQYLLTVLYFEVLITLSIFSSKH